MLYAIILRRAQLAAVSPGSRETGFRAVAFPVALPLTTVGTPLLALPTQIASMPLTWPFAPVQLVMKVRKFNPITHLCISIILTVVVLTTFWSSESAL